MEGGEFIKKEFVAHLLYHDILHQSSNHHARARQKKKNSIAEREHRLIIELGLAMMYQGSVPKRFWVEAFYAAILLINRLPTPQLRKNCFLPHW